MTPPPEEGGDAPTEPDPEPPVDDGGDGSTEP